MHRLFYLAAATSAVALAACGSPDTNATNTAAAQNPATAQDARGLEAPIKDGDWQLRPIATGFDYPWGLVFLPGDGGLLVSEREGRLSFVAPGEETGQAVSGAPEALIENQGGLLGLALDPDFAENRYVYLAYSKGTKSANSTALIRARLSENSLSLENVEQIFEASPTRSTQLHFGGRLLFLPDGTLLLSLGDGFRYMDDAQNPKNHHGTIVRLNTDGSIPADNPFADGKDGDPAVYSYGHRNVQGLALDPASGTIYANEHGPKGGDEINVIAPGKNYGWPEITYGVNYDGSIITRDTKAPGMEQPIVKWVPSIAPAGMVFYTGDKYSDWTGDLFVPALAGMKLQRVDLENGEVVGEEELFADAGLRLRHVVQGPDGYLYVASDEVGGSIWRVERTDETTAP